MKYSSFPTKSIEGKNCSLTAKYAEAPQRHFITLFPLRLICDLRALCGLFKCNILPFQPKESKKEIVHLTTGIANYAEVPRRYFHPPFALRPLSTFLAVYNIALQSQRIITLEQ